MQPTLSNINRTFCSISYRKAGSTKRKRLGWAVADPNLFSILYAIALRQEIICHKQLWPCGGSVAAVDIQQVGGTVGVVCIKLRAQVEYTALRQEGERDGEE